MATGFNVVDYMGLPPAERRLVRLILRQVSMSESALRAEVACLPREQRLTSAELDAALDHLTRSDWLVPERDGQTVIYRVNASQRNRQNQGLWDGIDLESIDSASPYDVDLESDAAARPMKRGGKRLLPHQIWDCLAEPQDTAPVEAPKRRPARQAGLLGTLFESGADAADK